MAWIPLTDLDIGSTLTGPELDNIRVAALKSGIEDPVDKALEEAMNYARGFISACEKNVMGPAGHIPQRLEYVILDIAAHKILTRVLITPSNRRHERYQDALATLKCVAKCEFLVEDPQPASNDPAEEAHHFPAPTVCAPARRFSRKDQDGI